MKSRPAILGLYCLALMCVISHPLLAAGAAAEDGCSTTVVRAWFSERSQVEAFVRHEEPWEIDHDKGWIVVGVDEATHQLLLDLGFEVEIDDDRTAEICTPRKKSLDQIEGIPGYGCYRTVEETYQAAQDLVNDFPNLASWIDVGDSWEKTTAGGNPGFDMQVLRLTNSNVTGTPPAAFTGKPRLFVTSAIHAREYTTAELMTRFAEYLVSNHGFDADATWLLDEHEIHLLLHTNPDGRKQAETGLSWRKNTNENYCSSTSTARGADLNRNFEFEWNCCGGSSSSECDSLFHGPSAASEPETVTVQNYIRSIFPDQRDATLAAAAPSDATGVYIDVHSYSELVLWPWGFTYSGSPNATALQSMGRRLAFFNDYEPEQASGLYPADGTTIDFAYGDLGVAAFLFELGTRFFEDCANFESTIFPDNLQAMIWAAKVVRTPYLTPAGPEMTGVETTAAVVAPGDVVTIQATADDTRSNNSNGSEPSQNISGSELFIDIPPWQAGASSTAMSAVDGSFDSTAELVEATIDTTGMADGRHLVYLRGEDADGNRGAVSGLFFWVLDPAVAAHISGTVTSAGSGAPLAATISTGNFTSPTNPASGFYDLSLPEGDYDVTVTVDGFGPQTATGVVTTSGEVTTIDWILAPYETIVEDDVEAGIAGWTAEGQWAITEETSASPSHSWTDSPGENYGDYWDDSLISPAIDFTGLGGVVLEFSHIYEFEVGYDYGHVEVSTDGGATWATVTSFNGFETANWERIELPLPQLDHAAEARIRFRIDTDVNTTEDGWHIDDILIRGFDQQPPGQLFIDGFESGDTSGWSTEAP